MLSTMLPLTMGTNGYAGFTDEEIKEAIKQNFRMLLLTAGGEYAMDMEFGVGLRNYLFYLNTDFPEQEVESRIMSQTSEYMPYVNIKSINFNTDNIDQNALGIRIEYIIMESVLSEILELTVAL